MRIVSFSCSLSIPLPAKTVKEDYSRRLFLDYQFRIDPDSISCSKVDLSVRKTEKEYQEMKSEIALVRYVGKATDDLSRASEN